MDNNSLGLIDQLTSWLGGWAVILLSGAMGRAMHISQEVKNGNRKLTMLSVLWEVPLIATMSLTADGLGSYLGLNQKMAVVLAGVFCWYGPKVYDVLIARFAKDTKDGE